MKCHAKHHRHDQEDEEDLEVERGTVPSDTETSCCCFSRNPNSRTRSLFNESKFVRLRWHSDGKTFDIHHLNSTSNFLGYLHFFFSLSLNFIQSSYFQNFRNVKFLSKFLEFSKFILLSFKFLSSFRFLLNLPCASFDRKFFSLVVIKQFPKPFQTK